MFSSTAKANGEKSAESLAASNYYDVEDFYEEESFLILRTDGTDSLPGSPVPVDKVTQGNSVDEEKTPKKSSLTLSQNENEDGRLEASVDHFAVTMSPNGGVGLNAVQAEAARTSLTDDMSVSLVSSVSTDTHLTESNKALILLMAENEKLKELSGVANEKMKQCITTIEKLRADHEEYKVKNEASREMIKQLREENEKLKSGLTAKEQELQKQDSRTIAELKESLNVALNSNGVLNDKLTGSQKANQQLQAGLQKLQQEKDAAIRQTFTLNQQINCDRILAVKLNQNQSKVQMELGTAKATITTLQVLVREKEIQMISLRKNMEDTVAALERLNGKLNEKEHQVNRLNVELAAVTAEAKGSENVQALKTQFEKYRSELEIVRKECAKQEAEKAALVQQLTTANQQLQQIFDASQVYRGQNRGNSSGIPNGTKAITGQGATAVAPGATTNHPLRKVVPPPSSSSSGFWNGKQRKKSLPLPAPVPPRVPPCPICSKTFASVDSLQRHASTCGVDDSFPLADDPFVFL